MTKIDLAVKTMTWETFYNNFCGWAGPTQRRHISYIKNFGSNHEIFEIVEACIDQKTINKLICKAMVSGVKFTPDEIAKLEYLVDKNLYRDLVKTS